MTANIPATHTELLDNPIVTIATVGEDGYPAVAAVWFQYENGQIKTSGVSTRKWFQNAARTGKATYFFTDASGYKTLEVRGDVTIEDDSSLEWMRHQFEKYDTKIEEFGDPEARLRRVLVLTPTKVRAWGGAS